VEEIIMAAESGRVVIVGAGPAGMALAYLLARRGVGVTVLETHHDFARAFRGEGLQRSGIDAFRQMGLGEQFDRLPHVVVQTIELHSRGRLVFRAASARHARAPARAVSQPALLNMLADEAGKHPSFRLERGVTMRDFLRENGRVAGVRTSADDGPREFRADLVVGADGRHAASRKQSGLAMLSIPQRYDVLWLKVPFPDGHPDQTTVLVDLAANRVLVAFPAADGQLQVGFFIPKGSFPALRARAVAEWTDELIGRAPTYLADHLRAHREAVAGVKLLDVVCGRLTEWTLPGLLLIGDAAHPMSPIGGQGINLALRDALVAANHLCPVLADGGDPSAIDATTRRVRDERWPEIVAVQQMQENQGRQFFSDRWITRLVFRVLLPFLMRSGNQPWLQRKETRLLSDGVVPVRLVV
jgi:2-polyprenyl-6-methoxyphenol hydroxylase-like FAD-dependent oxidoreductase